MQQSTTEARRAASKVFNGFMILVVANVIIIALVMWPRGDAPEKPVPSPVVTQSTEALEGEMKRVLDTAMAAWGKGDATAFYAQFAAKYVPADSVNSFQRLFAGVYGDEFGKIKAMKLNARESSSDPDYGMLVFDAECEKHPKARLSANFLREAGQLKLAQIRLEKLL